MVEKFHSTEHVAGRVGVTLPGAASEAIVIERVSKTFQTGKNERLEALDSIDLDIAQGEFIVLLGPSGCGKTTLLRIIGGLEEATQGRVRLSSQSARTSSDIGFVFQDATLMPWRSALRNVALPLELMGSPKGERRARAETLLELVGLEEFGRKLPHQLSGGMRQRVSIARALAHDPPVLLMDEPFGALDAQTRETMNVELQRIWMESRKTVVFVTHSVEEAVFLADRVVLLDTHPGRIQSITTVDFPRPRHPDLMESDAFRDVAKRLRGAIAGVGAADPTHASVRDGE